MIDKWTKIVDIIEQNRDAHELDITVEEARGRHIVAGNETYVGRRVIAGNITRELPTFLQYLTGSRRHIVVTPIGMTYTLDVTTAIETEFTEGFRTGGWFEQHLQVLNSFALHGRGVFMVRDNPASVLGTAPVYIPPEDFIFPLGTRDIQKAPMLGVKYSVSSDQFKTWSELYGFTAESTQTIYDNKTQDELVNKMIELYLMFIKDGSDIVHTFWYSKDMNKIIRKPEPFTSGEFLPGGAPAPATIYPFFPCYYRITENPKLIERKGRAHDDMHDQEALTMMWTAAVNQLIRASELYANKRDTDTTENPEVVQTAFVVEPGKITKTPIDFFSPPAPDPTLFTGLQSLKSENASAAGQVDFAAQVRKDSRKTATELDLAAEQTAANKSVPLSMFATGYKPLLAYMVRILRSNIRSGVNTQFLADNPEAKQAWLDSRWEIQPAGDVDYVERNEQLQLYMQLYPLYQPTALNIEFLRKILELAFPKDYKKLAPLLVDNSKQMLAALIPIVANMPMDGVPPEVQQKLQEILQAAQAAVGPQDNVTSQTTTPAPSGPGTAAAPQGMAGAPGNQARFGAAAERP